MPDCTPSPFLVGILTYVLPPVGALLSATALWVGSRARTTSEDALQTSQAAVSLSLLQPQPPGPSASPPAVPDQRK